MEMDFGFNKYLDKNTRIVVVARDILKAFPMLTNEQALKIAMKEKVIDTVDRYSYSFTEIVISRYYKIMTYLQRDYSYIIPFNKALKGAIDAFKIWTNTKEVEVEKEYLTRMLMKNIFAYDKGSLNRLPSYERVEEQKEELDRLNKIREEYERNHTMLYKPNAFLKREIRIEKVSEDILREYPELGIKKAKVVASLEEEIGENLSEEEKLENSICRGMNIMSVAIADYHLEDAYNRAYTKLRKDYDTYSRIQKSNLKNTVPYYIMGALNNFDKGYKSFFPSYRQIKEKHESHTTDKEKTYKKVFTNQ